MKLFNGLFGQEQTAVSTAQAHAERARERTVRLQTQLTDARRELAQRKAGATQAALDDHAQDVEEWGAEVAAQAATCDALSAALATATAELKAAELALAVAQDSEERAASVAEIEALQGAMREPFEQLIDAATRLVPLARKGATFALDVSQVSGWIEQIAAEAPQAFETTNTGLEWHIEQIRAGTVRATLPRVDEQKPAVVTTKPPVQMGIISKYSIRWTDENGQTRTNPPFWDAGLPPTIAARAIEHGIAVASDHPEAKALRVKRTGFAADLSQLVDLDVEHPAPPPAVPERWLRPGGQPRWQPPNVTSQSLTSLTGTQAWIRPGSTNTEGF